MYKTIISYMSLALIEGTEFLAPVYLTEDEEISLCNCIHGYSYHGVGCDILFVNDKLDFNKPYISKINRYGFIQAVYGDKVVKRHISKVSDIKGIFMTEDLQDIVYLGELGVRIVKHRYTRVSSECFVIRTYKDNVLGYVSLTGDFTTDITEAWFTFDKSQALSYAGRLLLKGLRVYETMSVDDAIELNIYEMEM